MTEIPAPRPTDDVPLEDPEPKPDDPIETPDEGGLDDPAFEEGEE
jgi:hypothetical protein